MMYFTEKEVLKTLNSTLDIFIPNYDLKSVCAIFFKFHSGYIYTKIFWKVSQIHLIFKFHSGYIYTETYVVLQRRTEHFKFHSGYIYTDYLSKTKSLAKAFKFHSGYIYTYLINDKVKPPTNL